MIGLSSESFGALPVTLGIGDRNRLDQLDGNVFEIHTVCSALNNLCLVVSSSALSILNVHPVGPPEVSFAVDCKAA